MEGENYMKKRGRVLILLITAALAIEPLQLVYAEPAVDNLTGTVSQETGAEIRDENESAQPEPKPGWVSVEKGYQWRQEEEGVAVVTVADAAAFKSLFKRALAHHIIACPATIFQHQ